MPPLRLLLSCVLACPAILLAQGESAPPVSMPDDAPAKAPPPVTHWSHDFPFENEGGKIFIPVMVNGKGPFPFAIDTAAPPTVLDTDTAKEIGLPIVRAGEVGGAGEGTTPQGMTENVTLEFGGIKLERRLVMTASLNSQLAGFSGHEIRGLIGNDFVSTHVVEIDYANSRVTVRDPSGWKYDGTGIIVPSRSRGYTYVKGSIKPPGEDAIPVRWVIDTGAGLSAAINTPFVNEHHLLDLKTPMIETVVGYGLGGRVLHHVCRLDSLSLGDVTIERPVVTLSQDHGGALASQGYDGIIGYEVLSKFKVIFDGPHRRMILEPSPTRDAPMAFDMSGVVLAADGAGGLLRIMYVAAGSPAEEAGIKEDDLVVSVDGRPCSGKDREKVRVLFRKDGEHTLELKRGEAKVGAKLKLRQLVENGKRCVNVCERELNPAAARQMSEEATDDTDEHRCPLHIYVRLCSSVRSVAAFFLATTGTERVPGYASWRLSVASRMSVWNVPMASGLESSALSGGKRRV